MSFSYILVTIVMFANFGVIPCTEELPENVRIIDVVTFMEELNQDIVSVKGDLLFINVTVANDAWSQWLKFLDGPIIDMVEEYVKLLRNPDERLDYFCIENAIQKSAETQVFGDQEFSRTCSYGKKYIRILNEAYEKLLIIEEEARVLPNDFVTSNLWCSTNHNTDHCFNEVTRQIAQIAVTLDEALKSIENTVGAVNAEYALIGDKCLSRVNDKSLDLGAIIIENVRFCFEPGSWVPET